MVAPSRSVSSNRRIGDVVRLLGLEVRKAHGNKAAVVWDEAKIRTLVEHYAPAGEQAREKKASGTPDGAGSADANHATQANPPDPGAPYSVDSMVSEFRGDRNPKADGIFSGEASGGRPDTGADQDDGYAEEELPW
jgi:hypothetical protein